MEKIEYIDRMRHATDPELEYYHYDEDYDFEVESPMVILREASEEYGERFASQLRGVADSHFPKRYGEEGLSVDWGYDYLDSFWKEPMRIRKDGKVHRQDIKSRKSYLVHRRGFELEGHCECGCRWTKKSQKLRKNSFYYEYPEYDVRKG
mgnify:FL=1|jgi:hypothetical protein|tara:strand:- start:239 stop:688 length:450 start_codon:yes stop_codon:yes gene_type:complete